MEEGRNDGGRRKKRREEGTEEGRKGKEGENQRGRVIEEENWDIGREEAGGGGENDGRDEATQKRGMTRVKCGLIY